MPLRETQAPPHIGPDGTEQPGHAVVYYQPFTTTDLLNWKHHTPSYSEKPQALINLKESIMQTHRPTWYDCRQLLLTLFNTEECQCILQEAHRHLEVAAPVGTLDPAQWARVVAPEMPPDWDHTTEEGRAALARYRDALLHGIRAGARRPTNMSRVANITQRPDECPGDFLERLCEAYGIYTPFDPESPDN